MTSLTLLRCPKRECRSNLTVRSGSEFFSFENNKNRLSLYQILKINRKTVYDWRSLFRDPTFILFDRADPMGGEGDPPDLLIHLIYLKYI